MASSLEAVLERHGAPPVYVASHFDSAVKRLCNSPASVVEMVNTMLDIPRPNDFSLPLVSPSEVVDAGSYREHVRAFQTVRLMMTIEAHVGKPLRTSVDTYDSEHHDEWVAQQADPVTGEIDLVALVALLLLRSPASHSYESLYRLLSVVRELKQYPYESAGARWVKASDVPHPVSLPEMRRRAGVQLDMMELYLPSELDHEFAMHVRGEVERLKDDNALGDAARVQDALAGFLRAQEVADDSPELHASRREAVCTLSWLVRRYARDVSGLETKIARNIFFDTMQRLRATRVLVVDGLLMPLHPFCFTSTSASPL